jgi:hypothetical protein
MTPRARSFSHTARRLLVAVLLALALVVLVNLAAPAPAQASFLGIDLNPIDLIKSGATTIVAAIIKALVQVFFGSSLGQLIQGLVQGLVALPLFASTSSTDALQGGSAAAYAHVGAYESWVQSAAWGLLPLFVVGAAVHYLSVGITGEGDAYQSARALGRAIVAGAGLIAWPHLVDLGERVANELSWIALHGPYVQQGLGNLGSTAIGSVTAGALGSPGIGIIAAVGILIIAVMLIVTKIVLTAALAMVFAIGPLLIPFWVFEATAWIARTIMQTLLGLLLWPILWAFCFAVFGVLSTATFGLGSLGDVLQPLVLLSALVLAWKLPAFALRQAIAAGLMPSVRGVGMQAYATYQIASRTAAAGAGAGAGEAAAEAAA